ncbi:MAG: hypothetical protein P8X89_06095, partial [Reinekea sp.]
MERTHNSFNIYHTDDYYSQVHQENAQYASEAGQTSAGVSAGGASTPKSNYWVREQLLLGFGNYEQGFPLEDCSTTLDFKDYLTNDGKLTGEGRTLYDNYLLPEERARFNLAMSTRRHYMPSEAKLTRIMQGLEMYAGSGLSLEQCSRHTSSGLGTYITEDGSLQPGRGEFLYNSLRPEDRQRVDQALHYIGVSQLYTDQDPFLESLDNYAKGVPIMECSGDIPISRYVTDDGHLQPGRGESLYDILSDND